MIIIDKIQIIPMFHKFHYAIVSEKLKLIEKIYRQRKEKLNKYGIEVSLEELLKFYK